MTGAVLTILGATMLILHYWTFLSQFELFVQTLMCLGKFALFIFGCLIILIPVYLFVKLPSFVFRKLLHVVAFSCVTLMIGMAESWLSATLASVTVAVVLFPILMILEKEPWYSKLFVEKSKGEIKRSLLMLFLMFATLTAVSWGVFGKIYACVGAILMWGFGDASAALIGIPFGKHKVRSKLTDGKKSYEGTISMFIVSFIIGSLYLHLSGSLTLGWAVLAAFIGSIIGAVVELFSKSEFDTVTVPVAIITVLLFF